MQTADAGLLFQSESAHERVAARQWKASRPVFSGLPEPIKVSSKPLAIQVDGQDVWVAEANNSVKKIDIATGKLRKLFKGHQGPVTSLALWRQPIAGTQQKPVLITGSWDKSIRLWDAESKEELCCVPDAHTDFVKALLVIPELDLLVSGGSDKDVRLWDLKSLHKQSETTASAAPAFLASLRSHTRPIDSLAALRIGQSTGVWSLWTADSMGKLAVWRLSRSSDGSRIEHSEMLEWRPHETAITDMSIWTFHDEPKRPAELWTSSADGTVLLHTFSPSSFGSTTVEPTLRLRVPHGDIVRSVWPNYEDQMLVTGSSDEKIRVWDLEELLQSPPPKKGWTEDKDTKLLQRALISEVDEHYHDVHILTSYLQPSASGELEPCLMSGSLDGTLRVWSVKQLQEWRTHGRPVEAPPAEGAKQTEQEKNVMNADEEAELEALMNE